MSGLNKLRGCNESSSCPDPCPDCPDCNCPDPCADPCADPCGDGTSPTAECICLFNDALSTPGITVIGDGSNVPFVVQCPPCMETSCVIDVANSTVGMTYVGTGDPSTPFIITCPAPPPCEIDDSFILSYTGVGSSSDPFVPICPPWEIDLPPGVTYTGGTGPGDPFVLTLPPCEFTLPPGATSTGTGEPGDPIVVVCPTPEIDIPASEATGVGCCSAGTITYTGTGLPGDPFVVTCNGPGASAFDQDNGDGDGSPVVGAVSSNDVACTDGTTTYQIVAGTEVNGTATAFNGSTGIFTFAPTGPGCWRFQYELLCDGVVVDSGWEFGNVPPVTANAVDTDNGDGDGSPVTGFTGSNDTVCTSGVTSYQLVAGSEVNGTVDSFNGIDGAFQFTPAVPGCWRFQYELLCDGVVIDSGWEFGNVIGNPPPLADAVDDDYGLGDGSPVTGNVAASDTVCATGTTTWEAVPGSEVGGTVTAFDMTNGDFTFEPNAPQCWRFQYNILCDGVVVDSAWQFGTTDCDFCACSPFVGLEEHPVLPDSDIGIWELPWFNGVTPGCEVEVEWFDQSFALIETATFDPAVQGPSGTYGTMGPVGLTFNKKQFAIDTGTYLNEHDVHGSGDPIANGLPANVWVRVTPVGCIKTNDLIPICPTGDFSTSPAGEKENGQHAHGMYLDGQNLTVGGLRYYWDHTYGILQTPPVFTPLGAGGPYVGDTFSSSDVGCLHYHINGTVNAAPDATRIWYTDPWKNLQGGQMVPVTGPGAGNGIWDQIASFTNTTYIQQTAGTQCTDMINDWMLFKRNPNTTCSFDIQGPDPRNPHTSVRDDMIFQTITGSIGILFFKVVNGY